MVLGMNNVKTTHHKTGQNSVIKAITGHVMALLSAKQPNDEYLANKVSDQAAARQEQHHGSVIVINFVEDTLFDEWGTLDKRGRSLELDIEVTVRGRGMENKREAEAIEALIREILGGDKGKRHVVVQPGSPLADVTPKPGYRAEHVKTVADESIDLETDLARLTMQYSMIYRVRRDNPNILTN